MKLLHHILNGILAAMTISQPLVQAAPAESISATTETVAASGEQIAASKDQTRPFYAISHQVLQKSGVRDALKNGANATEIDVTAWSSGWWADHDGLPTRAGDTAEKMFQTIAAERRAGTILSFINTSIKGLRELARDILQPAGVKVLYGLYKSTIGKRAYKSIRSDLNEHEALNVDAEVAVSERELAYLPRGKRVYSNGCFDLALELEGPFENLSKASKRERSFWKGIRMDACQSQRQDKGWPG
ncbi:phospholipase D [Metarhizium robertsii ARSEF 23]|uniref:Phospholipase D n=1 Tax=Metarhizium robertsii (strain ARSEF 23 / ATCC MYA-3075) TaxID=655844 RepID=E9EK47_METRA|nr:phospholipase D [Metarhizium robertsii ARSEF 23]EFZ03387.1 phospholipase D [Metarhizium robertsii ARSEF 23]